MWKRHTRGWRSLSYSTDTCLALPRPASHGLIISEGRFPRSGIFIFSFNHLISLACTSWYTLQPAILAGPSGQMDALRSCEDFSCPFLRMRTEEVQTVSQVSPLFQVNQFPCSGYKRLSYMELPIKWTPGLGWREPRHTVTVTTISDPGNPGVLCWNSIEPVTCRYLFIVLLILIYGIDVS